MEGGGITGMERVGCFALALSALARARARALQEQPPRYQPRLCTERQPGWARICVSLSMYAVPIGSRRISSAIADC